MKQKKSQKGWKREVKFNHKQPHKRSNMLAGRQQEQLSVDEVLLRIRDKASIVRVTLEEMDSLAVSLRNELVITKNKLDELTKEKEKSVN